MQTLWQDLRFGARMFVKNPGFAALAVLSIALGIGANATIFSWVKSVFLLPVPGVAKAEELAVVTGATPTRRGLGVSYPDYADFRERNEVFSGLAAFNTGPFNLGYAGRADVLWGAVVSGNYFDVLGVKAQLGRTFLPEEDKTKNTHPVVVISHDAWQQRFAGQSNIVGQTLLLNGRPFTIIGVTPRDFGGSFIGVQQGSWIPLMMKEVVFPAGRALENRGDRWLNVIGRLKPGASFAQVQANLTGIATELGRVFPDSNAQRLASVYTLAQSPNGPQNGLRPMLTILMVIVGVVLLIACANVANLLMAKATGRRKEISIRLALGAGRGRLMRQLLTESLLLAVLGGGLGLLMTAWTANTLTAFLPPVGIPLKFDTSLDARVLLFTALATLLTGVLFGLLPAWQATRRDLTSALKEEAANASGGAQKARLRGALVVAQVALSVLALVCAGLFVRSLAAAQRVDLGFNPDNVLLASLDLTMNNYDEARAQNFYRELPVRIAAVPGVESVTLTRRTPLGAARASSTSIEIEGYKPAQGEELSVGYETIAPEYFRTLEISLVRGREFTERDDERAVRVVVINDTLAARYWPGQDAAGKRLRYNNQWHEIVGVARTIKYAEVNEIAKPFLFLPLRQNYQPAMTLAVRVNGDAAPVFAAIQRTLAQMDANLPIYDLRTLVDAIGVSLFLQRMAAKLLSLFGLLALALAAIGLYGVMAFAVSQRTREIGIRMALGARGADVMKLVVGQGMRLALLGLGLGLGGAWALTRLFKGVLVGVSASDPLSFAVVALLLGAVAGLACYLPARRATKVDPMIALRCE
ncbi:MAG: ABC transporter permease [Blastocatellia bacterium]